MWVNCIKEEYAVVHGDGGGGGGWSWGVTSRSMPPC